MTFFLVFLAILAAGFVVVMALGRFNRQGSSDGKEAAAAWRWERGEVPAVQGLAEPVANLPPVLLPPHPTADDVDRLRFSPAFRGYRMDQVDEVLDCLRDELAGRDERIAELEKHAGIMGGRGAEGPAEDGVEGPAEDGTAIMPDDTPGDRTGTRADDDA
ncbi:DivIVA domain-containing protein [Arthrobacter monumenti]